MAFTPFVETDQPTMENFNEKFQQCIAEAISHDVQIETGSYVGTGNYGSGNANNLQFSFTPKIVFIRGIREGSIMSFLLLMQNTGIGFAPYAYSSQSQSYYCGLYTTISNNGITWYVNSNVANQDAFQGNSSGITYNYVAIGMGETV